MRLILPSKDCANEPQQGSDDTFTDIPVDSTEG